MAFNCVQQLDSFLSDPAGFHRSFCQDSLGQVSAFQGVEPRQIVSSVGGRDPALGPVLGYKKSPASSFGSYFREERIQFRLFRFFQ